MWRTGWTIGHQGETDTIPIPKVIIDQDSDLDATVVKITFGDRLGALLDTVMHSLSKFMLMHFYLFDSIHSSKDLIISL